MAHDLRALVRLRQERDKESSAAVMAVRTVQSTPESGHRAGFDGHKRKRGSKVHAAVDTLGLLLSSVVTSASVHERAQVEQLASEVQAVTGENVDIAFVDQGYTGGAIPIQWIPHA